jgi:ribosomal lysine N-methyltransferase 2
MVKNRGARTDGFVPNQNRWDAIFLDNIILNDLSAEKREDLKLERYLG